jgi:DNA-binding CsgD family transcriptional regulator
VHRAVYGGTAGRFRSALVGRESELDQLRRTYDRASSESGVALLLWGEAGVGKTRLLEEFATVALSSGAQIAAASCFEALCPPFAPLRELLAALALADPFGLDSFVSSAQPSEGARYRAYSDAASALGSIATPLVLLLDDLQWADFATLDFLAFLTPRLAGSRILVLGAVRSDQLERDHVRVEAFAHLNRRGASTLNVDPLGTTEMRRLVAGLWPAGKPLEERAVDRVCALAEGKPYFAEELVDSALTARDPTALEVAPLSIRAGVLARFERLAPDARRILLNASVIGRGFDAAFLEELCESTNAAVCEALAAARDLQLVREVRERAGHFAFRHAITREILYHEMLTAQARSIHRAVAERLAQADAADPFDLAHHWHAAGDHPRASEAYERAGDAALYRNAHRDAEVAYRGAVESRDPADGTYPPLCEKFSRALSANGHVDDACAFAERALDAYETAGETEKAASLAIRLARRIYESGRAAEAGATAQRALRLCAQRGPIAYDAYVTLAHFEALQGRNDAATAYLVSAEAAPGEHPGMQRRNSSMVQAVVAATSGRLTEAFEHYETAVAIARELDDAEQLAWTLNNYASRAMATGWMDRALAAHREAAECLRREEFGKVGASTIQGAAFAELLAGDLSAVRALQQEDSRLPRGIAMTQTARTALGVRMAYYSDDDAEAARLITPEALELAFESGEAQRIGLLAGCVAAYYDAGGRSDEANTLRSRALRTIRTVDFSFWLLDQMTATEDADERQRARHLLAEAAADRGNLAAAAHLALFDARLAARNRSTDAKSRALEAAAKFEAIGWPWERAQALEIAGRYAEASDLYRRHGFARNARMLEERRRRIRHRAGARELTPREHEVALLAAQGKSNRAIAAELFIGERTVETHISAIFDRFELRSRRELAALVGDSGQQVVAEPPA